MTYVVKKGDNLSTIAKQNGLTLKQLLSLNKNIDNPDYIQIGQKINLKENVENKPTWKGATQKRTAPELYKNFNISPKIEPDKKVSIPKSKSESTSINKIYKEYQVPKEEPSFFGNLKESIYEKYQDSLTALDQQTAPKIATKPNVKIDDSFIDYGYKELGTYKDQSFKAGKNDSLLSAVNLFDNDKGFNYVVSPKVKEGIKTYNDVKGVAHFLMDSDITPNQKYTEPYIEKGKHIVKSAVKGKFTPNIGTKPSDYVMYYKNLDGERVNVKYGQLKDKNKYEGYDQIKVRSVPFSDLDFNKKTNAGFLKKASYIGTRDGKQTSIITDPDSNDVFGRFSGGSGVFYFKEPKTGKTLSMDVSGSVNTIKSVGEEISKKYGLNPKELQFLYHDMGSYSAKPKSHNGVLSNEQWQNYNVNNKGYSGAALMYPMEFGGMIASDNINMGYYTNHLKHYAGKGLNTENELSYNSTDTVLNLNKFKETVPEFIYNGYLNSGKEGIYKNVDKLKFPVLIRTLQDGTTIYMPYTYENVQDNSIDAQQINERKTPINQTSIYKNGGIVKDWIQKFSKGGYIADRGFPGGQELTQPTTNYYNWGNYGNQNSFLTPDQINQKPFENPYQNMNLQQPNVPQFNIPKGQEIEPLTSIGAQKMTPDLQGIRNRVNQSMQDIAPESKSPMNMNAVNMGLDIGTQSMSTAANLMSSLGKDNSKAQAFGQGATGAMNVASQATAPFKDIPIAGKAIDAVGKTLGFFIGGALEARRQGIENEEMDKYNKLQEYTSRNTQTAQQPSYYGQYMSKYGSNIKNLEQRLVDDIFSDYDKFMKLT